MSDSTPAAPARRDPYAALRFRDFRLLIIGRFIAQIGEMMVSVGVGWELYERTGDALALGLVGLAQIVPVMLLSVVGGYVADRYNRKMVTLVSQVVLIVCSLALAVISITDGSLVVLYGVLALIGAARAFNNPAESALTPLTVPSAQFMNAVTWNSTVWQLSAILGPAFGGFLIALSNDAALVYIVNAAAGGVLVGALLMLNVRQQTFMDAGDTPVQAVRKGWHFLRRSPIIFASISLDMFAVLFGGATFLLPVFAKDILLPDFAPLGTLLVGGSFKPDMLLPVFGGDMLFNSATGLGILRAAGSVGALCMAIYIARRPPFQHAGRTLLLAVAGFGVATIVFGLSSSFLLSTLMLFLLGALDNISVVVRHTLIMTQTPDEMRGRVSAVNSVFIGASNELGGFESGIMAAIFGPVVAVVMGGLGTIAVVGVIAYLVPPLRRYGTLGD